MTAPQSIGQESLEDQTHQQGRHPEQYTAINQLTYQSVNQSIKQIISWLPITVIQVISKS